MEKISIGKDKVIFIDDRIQVSNLGREFRLVGCKKVGTIAEKYLQGVWKSYWRYSFIYLDTSQIFEVEIDYFNKFTQIKFI